MTNPTPPPAQTTQRLNVEDVLTRLAKLEGVVLELSKQLADALEALNAERSQMLKAFDELSRLVTLVAPSQGHS